MTNELENVTPLSGGELLKLKVVLEKIEAPEKRMYRKINGGFAQATMFNYDNEYIDVEYKFGVQSDTEDNVYTEQLKIDRATFEIVD